MKEVPMIAPSPGAPGALKARHVSERTDSGAPEVHIAVTGCRPSGGNQPGLGGWGSRRFSVPKGLITLMLAGSLAAYTKKALTKVA